MHISRVHRISDRIVSISQPHVRPIVRGKAGTKVEFVAKISLSLIDGKFGQGKRSFGLSRIMAKLAQTSECMIMISFMVMNLEKMLTKALSFGLYLYSILLIEFLGDP